MASTGSRVSERVRMASTPIWRGRRMAPNTKEVGNKVLPTRRRRAKRAAVLGVARWHSRINATSCANVSSDGHDLASDAISRLPGGRHVSLHEGVWTRWRSGGRAVGGLPCWSDWAVLCFCPRVLESLRASKLVCSRSARPRACVSSERGLAPARGAPGPGPPWRARFR
eukprot:6213724-Pleurochrysis_carterae.AAC.1